MGSAHSLSTAASCVYLCASVPELCAPVEDKAPVDTCTAPTVSHISQHSMLSQTHHISTHLPPTQLPRRSALPASLTHSPYLLTCALLLCLISLAERCGSGHPHTHSQSSLHPQRSRWQSRYHLATLLHHHTYTPATSTRAVHYTHCSHSYTRHITGISQYTATIFVYCEE